MLELDLRKRDWLLHDMDCGGQKDGLISSSLGAGVFFSSSRGFTENGREKLADFLFMQPDSPV